jgi:hypothetical protein
LTSGYRNEPESIEKGDMELGLDTLVCKSNALHNVLAAFNQKEEGSEAY